MWIVIFKSYGTWRTTSPFKTEGEARRHAELYITTKEQDYNTNVDFVYLPQMED